MIAILKHRDQPWGVQDNYLVDLSCGCFFKGREFIADPCCETHAADIGRCCTCGDEVHLDMLDSKPTMTWWLRTVRFFRGQRYMLQYAADRGYEFDVFECSACYGPGYVAMEVRL